MGGGLAGLLEGDYRDGEERSRRFAGLDAYYVLWAGPRFGHARFLTQFNYDRALRGDPRFKGFLSLDGSSEGLDGLPEHPVVTPAALAADPAGRVGFVSFSSTPEELDLFQPFRSDTYSFVCVLHARNEVHTYVTIEDERRFIMDNLDRYAAICDGFEDETSRQMLTARLRGIVSLDLEPVIRNHFDVGLAYFNDQSPEFSFTLNRAETYCDIGASGGDCVLRFAGMVPDLTNSRIYAFEPNAVEFETLKGLEASLPLTASNAIVSDVAAGGYFRTDSGNPLGSRTAQEGAEIDARPTVRLDDVCERATLIKIDAEGAEPRILAGAARLLSDPGCRLSTCIYHYPGDLLQTVDIMQSLGRRRFFFRQHSPSLWDGLLYFH